jgi:hypothetical protein
VLHYSSPSNLLEESHFLPVTDLERFLVSKWKHASHFQPYHLSESASLTSDSGLDQGSDNSAVSLPLELPVFNLSLSLSLASCSAISASSSNASGILKAAKQLVFQAQSCLGTCTGDHIVRMFDADAVIQIFSIGQQLPRLPSFGLSTADCVATALKLALYLENFPLLCHVLSHTAKLNGEDGSAVVKAICDSGVSPYSEVFVPLCCNITDLSPGPSFSLPFSCDSIFDCIVASLSGKIHCIINAIRDGRHVILDYTLPEAALSRSDCFPEDSHTPRQQSSASNAPPPHLKGVLRASNVDAILEQGNSPFARSGFSDQVVAKIAEGVSSEELSSYLTGFLGDDNLVVSLVQWVLSSLPTPSISKLAWKRNTSGCFGTELTAVFDCPPSIMNYLGRILIIDANGVRHYDGVSVSSVPEFSWVNESQRQIASILHQGSHCVVGRILFVASEIADQSCTLLQALDPSADWNVLFSYRVKVPFCRGLSHHLGHLLMQQSNDGSSITYAAVPLFALTSTKFQEDVLPNFLTSSVRLQSVPSSQIRYSDDRFVFAFHGHALDTSHKSCTVSFLVDSFTHNQSQFEWLPPINDSFFQLSDFVSRTTPPQGNVSHEGVCTYNGWALSRARHPEIKDSTVILDRPIVAINRERYFEVVIQKSSEHDGVSLGLCHSGYELLRSHPGWYPSSVGYHGDDGRFYVGDPDRKQHSASLFIKKGEVAGCGILDHDLVFFTRNGNLVGVFHIPGSTAMHPAFGGRKDDDAESGNEYLVRLAPPFSFQPANIWPNFALHQSIIERSWSARLLTPVHQINPSSSASELCASVLANFSRSAQIEFELSRVGAYRGALVFSYNSSNWKFVSNALSVAPNSSHNAPAHGGRGERRSRSSRQDRRNARNSAADHLGDAAVPVAVVDAQSSNNALPSVLEIYCNDCTHTELFICPSSFIGSVAFKVSRDSLGKFPLGDPLGYSASRPIPGLRGFPSIVIPCNRFYVHFTEFKGSSFYSFSIIALPIMTAGCVRIDSNESLLDLLSLIHLDSSVSMSQNAQSQCDSAINILRVQAQRGWLQFVISKEVPNSPGTQSLIQNLSTVLKSGRPDVQFAAAGLFLHCLAVHSFASSLTVSQLVDLIIQISHLGMESKCLCTSFLETGYLSLAHNAVFWNNIFQNAALSSLEKLVSTVMSFSLWHNCHKIATSLTCSFHSICKTCLVSIFSQNSPHVSLRLHFLQILRDAAKSWLIIDDQSLISESFLSCVAMPIFLMFDVEYVNAEFYTSLVDLLSRIYLVIEGLLPEVQYHSLCVKLRTTFNLGLSTLIRSAEFCFVSSQLSESFILRDLMSSKLFASGFVSHDDSRDAAAEFKRAIIHNDDSIQHIFELLNEKADFKVDFSKVEHRTSAFLFLSASGLAPYFQGYNESRELLYLHLHTYWQDYLSCTKDCWSDSAVVNRANMCLDLQSLNSWSALYPVEYVSSSVSQEKNKVDEEGLLSQLLKFIKSDVSPNTVKDSFNCRQQVVSLRLQGLFILRSCIEMFGHMPSACDVLLSVSYALVRSMSNDKTTSNVLGSFCCHQELIDAYSAFMTSFTNVCIKSSSSQISQACILYMTKLHPNDEKWVASASFQSFLHHLISLDSSQHPMQLACSKANVRLSHSFSACWLPSGHWICHGGFESVDSVLVLSSKFWMREISGDWHLLECFGNIPQVELGLVGHTLTPLPNGTIVITGGYSNPSIENMQKLILATVDVHKKSVVLRHVVLNSSVTVVRPMDHSSVFDHSTNTLIIVGGCSTKFKQLSQCILVSIDLSNAEPSWSCKLVPEPDRSVNPSPLGRKPALCISREKPSKLFVYCGDCLTPSILELDLLTVSSDSWTLCCNIKHAGIGRSMFIDNHGAWVLYGGYSSCEDPLKTIRVSSSGRLVCAETEAGLMRHFLSNVCVTGNSQQEVYHVLDGGCNTKCQQLFSPRIVEFDPNCPGTSVATKSSDLAPSNVGTLLKVLAMQSVGQERTIPRSWFNSIWNHYANSFFRNSKHFSSLVKSRLASGTVLIDDHFSLEQWNGIIPSESGHVTIGSWCWVSSSRLSKPVTLFTLARNLVECCSVRLCGNRHVEVVSTSSSNMTTVHLRTDCPVPTSQWFHISVSVKCSAAFQCKLFIGGYPISPWTSASSLLNGTSRNSDDGKFFENTSFAVHIPSCNIVDADSIIAYNLVAVDSVSDHCFNEWSFTSPPSWDNTLLMIRQCKEIMSVLRSASAQSQNVVSEIPGFLSSIILSLLRGPKQVSIDCALYFSEVSGNMSIAELDAATSECNIGESSFVVAVLSRIRYLLPACLSHASSLLSILHRMFRSNSDSRKVVFQAIQPFFVAEDAVLLFSSDISSDICIAFAIISGDFHVQVPGAAVITTGYHGYVKGRSIDDIYVLHLDQDEYVVSTLASSSIIRDGFESYVEEDIYLSICRFCDFIMTSCNRFRNSTGVDIDLEIVCNFAIRTLCHLNTSGCSSSASQELNATLMRNLLTFSLDLSGIQDLSSHSDVFLLSRHVNNLKHLGLQPMNLRSLSNTSISSQTPPRCFEPLLGPCFMDTKREPGRTFQFHAQSKDSCSVTVGFIADQTLKELIQDSCCDLAVFPLCCSITMIRVSFPNASSRDVKISKEICSTGVMWASFQIDLNHFLLGLVTPGREPNVRQNSDNNPRFIGSEVPSDAVAGSRLPSLTSADICTLVLDFNTHSLTFYKNLELALSLPIGAGPYHVMYQGFVVSTCIKPIDSESDIIQSVLRRHGDSTPSPWPVGTRVALSPAFENFETAKSGPLNPGDFGVVKNHLEQNGYLVEASNGQVHAYPRQALVKDFLPQCFFTSVDIFVPVQTEPSSCTIKASWSEASAFTFDVQIDGRTIKLPPTHTPPKEAHSEIWRPFAFCKSGSPRISFSSQAASSSSESISACERIFHRRLIRRKRYREHALALAKRLSTLVRGVAEKASQLVSDHRKFREAAEVEFWALMHPSKRDRASWLKDLFEFGVRTRVAWKACERQSDVQAAGVWATDEANANSLPADSQSEDEEPVAGPVSSSFLPPTIPVSKNNFVVHLESFNRYNSFLSSHSHSQSDDGELATVKYEDPYAVLEDSSIDSNATKSSKPTVSGMLHVGYVDVTLLGICNSVTTSTAAHALKAILKTLHHVDFCDTHRLFSSVGSADVASFLFNFISSENMPIQFSLQIGCLFDTVTTMFGVKEFEDFLCSQITKDSRSCSRCLQFMNVVTSRWQKFSLLRSPSCIDCFTDALLTFSSPHLRIHILRLFGLCVAQFELSAVYFKKLFRILNAGYTWKNYSSYLDVLCPEVQPGIIGPFPDSDHNAFSLSSYAVVKALNASPSVQSALFELIVQVMLSPDGREFVSPLIFSSIPSSFFHAVWGISCCRPIALCSLIPEVSSILEAFEILSLSELVNLSVSSSNMALPAFTGASGIKICIPPVHGSFSVFWSDGRSLKFLPSATFLPPKWQILSLPNL